jgi:arsenate reductase
MVPPGGIRGGRPRLRGGPPRAARTPRAPVKKRVLFVCIGNSCRSQMAEGFARAYGSDVMVARSAGLSPATVIAPLTRQVLAERNIRIDDHFPKGLDVVSREKFDMVVNLSGMPLRVTAPRVVEWAVKDPIGQTESLYPHCRGADRRVGDAADSGVARSAALTPPGRVSENGVAQPSCGCGGIGRRARFRF